MSGETQPENGWLSPFSAHEHAAQGFVANITSSCGRFIADKPK
jgi:hypothetical protein